MLDTRYFRTSETILGKRQWAWLEQKIISSNANLHFIVSGTPITTPKIFRSEEWADYPKDEKKMLELLKRYKSKKFIILSGDKHFSAVIKKKETNEIMSSGLTHTPFVLYHPFLRLLYNRPALDKNYALIDIDWQKNKLNIKFQTQNEMIKHEIFF